MENYSTVPGILVCSPKGRYNSSTNTYIGIHKSYKIRPKCVVTHYANIHKRKYFDSYILLPTISIDTYTPTFYSIEFEDWGMHQEEKLKGTKVLSIDTVESYLWEKHHDCRGVCNIEDIQKLISIPVSEDGFIPDNVPNLPIYEKTKHIPTTTGKTCFVKKLEKYVMDDRLMLEVVWDKELMPYNGFEKLLKGLNLLTIDIHDDLLMYREKTDLLFMATLSFRGMQRKSGDDVFDKIVNAINEYVNPVYQEKNYTGKSVVYI